MSTKSKPIPMGPPDRQKGDASSLGIKSEGSYGLKSEIGQLSFEDAHGMTNSGNLSLDPLGSFGDMGDGFGSMSFNISSSDLARRSRTGSMGAGRSSISTSISGRLNLVSDLEQQGLINKDQKGNMKDMIISRDPELLAAMERYEQGQPQSLQQMIDQNKLRPSEDIADGLDLAVLNVGSLEDDDSGLYGQDMFDVIPFAMDDENFGEGDDFSGLGGSLPSYGLGIDGSTMFNDIGQVDDDKGPSDSLPLPPRKEVKEEIKREKGDAKPPTGKAASGSSSTSAPICINSNSTSRVTGSSPSRDQNDVVHTEGGKKIGAYSPNSRKARIDRFLEKRNNRVWTKKVKYDVRKNFADSRLRVKGRFVKKEDEELLRELLKIT